MDEKQIKMITEYLDKIGEKLGQGTDTIWPWLVKQQYVDAIIGIIFVCLFWGSGLWISRMWSRKWFAHYEKNDITSLYIIRVIFSTTCAIGMLGSLSFFIAEFFDMFNPQYWALIDILRRLK